VTAALSLYVAALNVRYRDVQHLLNIALQLWFWLTPIVYPSGFVYDQLATRHPALFDLFLANPLAVIAMGFQRALYRTPQPTVERVRDGVTVHVHVHVLPPVSLGWMALLLGTTVVGALILAGLAWRTFFHLSGDFAEEL